MVPKATERLEAMGRLIGEHNLGDEDRLTLAMKSMNLAALKGDEKRVFAEINNVSTLLPEKPAHLRVFRYNAAHALYNLGRHDACISITEELIPEYYDVLGLNVAGVLMKNPTDIFPLLKKDVDHSDDLKHLADCLTLKAHALNRSGRHAYLARMHAMKFYSMASALDSFA